VEVVLQGSVESRVRWIKKVRDVLDSDGEIAGRRRCGPDVTRWNPGIGFEPAAIERIALGCRSIDGENDITGRSPWTPFDLLDRCKLGSGKTGGGFSRAAEQRL